MKLDGLSWAEIQEIKVAIEETKRDHWMFLTKNLISKITDEQIIKGKAEFDADRNPFRVVGRCNKILEIIQTMDTKMQKELK